MRRPERVTIETPTARSELWTFMTRAGRKSPLP